MKVSVEGMHFCRLSLNDSGIKTDKFIATTEYIGYCPETLTDTDNDGEVYLWINSDRVSKHIIMNDLVVSNVYEIFPYVKRRYIIKGEAPIRVVNRALAECRREKLEKEADYLSLLIPDSGRVLRLLPKRNKGKH